MLWEIEPNWRNCFTHPNVKLALFELFGMRFAINRFNNHQFQSYFSIDAGRFENIGILRENKDLTRTQF